MVLRRRPTTVALTGLPAAVAHLRLAAKVFRDKAEYYRNKGPEPWEMSSSINLIREGDCDSRADLLLEHAALIERLPP